MTSKLFRLFATIAIIAMLASPASAQPVQVEQTVASKPSLTQPSNLFDGTTPLDPEGIQRLVDLTGGAKVTVAPQTGAVRFIRLTTDQASKLAAELGSTARGPEAQASAFFQAYGSLFGITDAASQLSLAGTTKDSVGMTHLTYSQVYQDLPVFAGLVRVHINTSGQIASVNGMFVPGLQLDTRPSISEAKAGQVAVDKVAKSGTSAVATHLLVYRTGLAQGVTGLNYLAYEVEVADGANVREFVYVDAHSGKVVDQITGVYEDLTRTIYNGTHTPAAIVWQESDPPYAGADADVASLIAVAEDTYDLIKNASGGTYLSFDGADALMESVANYDPGNYCPNANWNGQYTSFCTGVAGDDTVAHEWGHALTEYTHNLIYAWQPGALNESYSDIVGEAVDLINGFGKDAPGGLRTDGACSVFTTMPSQLTINAPADITGTYPAGNAAFGSKIVAPYLTSDVVLAEDGVGAEAPPADDGAGGVTTSSYDGCTAYTNAADVAGKIALAFRGGCTFLAKAQAAQAAGAAGLIISNHVVGGNDVIQMAGDDPAVTLFAISVGNNTGMTIYNKLVAPETVNATLGLADGGVAPDDSYRWLSGEDDPGFGEAIRDLWSPRCYSQPEKVEDINYTCSTSDNGGVHQNSGVPNHAFALLVDGGTSNGQTITGIGFNRAYAIYQRAETTYQTPTTDFSDHADALEQACTDLVGTEVFDLATGALSGETVTTDNCAQLAKAILATELRTSPVEQCNFQPLLDKATPSQCSVGEATSFFADDFETDPTDWTMGNMGVFTETYRPIDWEWSSTLPDGRTGSALFGIDDISGQCTYGAEDQSAYRWVTSPEIIIPDGSAYPRLSFAHYVATELGWDGGNVWISVNGGEDQLVAPADFIFNAYNSKLETPGAGNSNPLAGLPAFTGSDAGTVKGSWGVSMVDLSPYAIAGDTVQLTFAFGNDGCGGTFGWYVDDVEAYYCADEPAASIDLTAPEFAQTGQVIPVQIVATAPVSETLNGFVSFTDELPAGFEFAGELTSTFGTASFDSGTNTVSWVNQDAPIVAAAAPAHQANRPVELSISKSEQNHPSVASLAPLAPEAAVSLALDDGSIEGNIGINGGGVAYQFIYMNRFTPAAEEFPFDLNEIQVLYPSIPWGGMPVDSAVEIAVFQDADGDPTNGANLLGSFTDVVKAADNATWSSYDLSAEPIRVTGSGDVIIAVVHRGIESGVTPSAWPASMDLTTSYAERSWIGWWAADPPAPLDLPPDDTFAPIEAFGADFASSWMIRGTGETVVVPPAPSTVTVTFNVTVTATSGQVVKNIAFLDFNSHLRRDVALTTVPYDVTFVYHDLENVIPDDAKLYVAGDLNGWNTTALELTPNADRSVFTATTAAPDSSGYKYVINGSWDNGQGDTLNTGNRSYTIPVTSTAVTLNDYRAAYASYTHLMGPATADGTVGQPTVVITGEVYLAGGTQGAGAAPGLVAELGYGTGDDPSTWTWVPMTYSSENGNNDVYVGTITPTAVGVYHYAVRFNANTGEGNPNSQWVYGDLDGVNGGDTPDPFEIDQTGVLTVGVNLYIPIIFVNFTKP